MRALSGTIGGCRGSAREVLRGCRAPEPKNLLLGPDVHDVYDVYMDEPEPDPRLTHTLTYRLAERDHQRLNDLAKDTGRTCSSITLEALRAHLDRQDTP